MVPRTDPLAGYPPELIEVVAARAAEDADRVAGFLKDQGLVPPGGSPSAVPAPFLLGLGAAMRLLAWGAGGLDLNRVGLPTAREVMLGAFAVLAGCPGHRPTPDLSSARDIFRFGVERLAWAGPAMLRAEVLLDGPDEDELIAALARFLWDRRPAGPAERSDAP